MEAVAEYLTANAIDFKVRIFYLILSKSQLLRRYEKWCGPLLEKSTKRRCFQP